MSFGIMLLIVIGPIVVSISGLIIGLVKKNKTVILASAIILLILLVRAIFTYFALTNWTSMD